MNVYPSGHNPYPVYLGVTLDDTPSCRAHMTCITVKLRSHNNLIAKLAGTSWDRWKVQVWRVLGPNVWRVQVKVGR